jgi:hypothetical protein
VFHDERGKSRFNTALGISQTQLLLAKKQNKKARKTPRLLDKLKIRQVTFFILCCMRQRRQYFTNISNLIVYRNHNKQ